MRHGSLRASLAEFFASDRPPLSGMWSLVSVTVVLARHHPGDLYSLLVPTAGSWRDGSCDVSTKARGVTERGAGRERERRGCGR